MIAKRLSQRLILTNTDEVVFGISLPSETRINKITAQIDLIGSAFADFNEATAYACEVWILPVLDVDLADKYDDIWDQLVPKDTANQTLDLDTVALDTTPMWEPGEPDWTDLMEVGLRPERIWNKQRLLNLANGGSINTVQDNQTPFAPVWLPGDSFRIEINKNYFVRQPSVLVCGIGIPALDQSQTNLNTALAEEKWGQVKYIGHVLQRAMLHILGVVEAGAETPWIEATALLKEHLEPPVAEESSGYFISQSLIAYTKAMIDHSVVGEIGKGTITTGR